MMTLLAIAATIIVSIFIVAAFILLMLVVGGIAYIVANVINKL